MRLSRWLVLPLCVLAWVTLAAPRAQAQMRECWASPPIDLGVLDAHAVEAVAAVAPGPAAAVGGLVIVRRTASALSAVPLVTPIVAGRPALTGTVGGTPVAIAVDANEHVVDLWAVRDVYVLRTVGVCPNTGRSFHKCMHLRVLAPTGVQRGATLDEDVVEWSGVGTAAVVGDRLVTLRTPMYDASGVPAVATYRLSAASDAIARDGVVSRLGTDTRPDAIAVIGVRGEQWAALLVSSIGEAPPLLVTSSGARPTPRLSQDLVPLRASLEPDGTLAVLFTGRVARIAPDGSLREPARRVTSGADLPASLSADAPQVELRASRGHVLVADPDIPANERPLLTLGPSAAHAPVLAGASQPTSIVVLFTRAGRSTTAQAVPFRCATVYQH